MPGLLPALVAAGALWIPWAATPAGACSCLQNPPADRAWPRTDAVFDGFVVAAAYAPIRRDDGSELPSWTYRIEVRSAWKGVRSDTVIAMTGGDEWACGYPFRSGRRYLVWADRGQDGSLGTSLCTRTLPYPAAREDSLAVARILADSSRARTPAR